MSLLRVESLQRNFGGVRAVSDLDFAFDVGRIHSIIGPNGAGKTTLFNLVTGVYRPSAGRILFQAEDITDLPPYERARRGLSRTFQNLQIFFNMSAIENVMVGCHRHADTRLWPAVLRFAGMGAAERRLREFAAALMKRVGLQDYLDSDSASMPYGALKRLEIARALASRPVLLLLDEPAAGLNPTETLAIDRLIRQIAEDGVTVVLVEHNMRLVMEISDHIVVLDHGRKLAEGAAREVASDPGVIAAYLGSRATERRRRRCA
jgi:branched-chain amino acid transport system ATP-binding protein